MASYVQCPYPNCSFRIRALGARDRTEHGSGSKIVNQHMASAHKGQPRPAGISRPVRTNDRAEAAEAKRRRESTVYGNQYR